MRSRWKRVGLLLVSLGVFATLTGCTSAMASHPSVSPTPVAAPSTPSPTPALPAIDTVVIRPTGIDLMAEGTTRATLPYTDSADVFTAQLAIVFGSPATETFHASTGYSEADSTLYDWPGLRIADEHRKVGGPGPSPDGPPTLSLVATKPIIGIGVHIRTIQGIQPGDSVISVAARLGVDPGHPSTSTCGLKPARCLVRRVRPVRSTPTRWPFRRALPTRLWSTSARSTTLAMGTTSEPLRPSAGGDRHSDDRVLVWPGRDSNLVACRDARRFFLGWG